MLDKFIYGQITRISPEAPVPIISIKEETAMLGGAGNVARNLISLSANTVLVSVIGSDAPGHEVAAMLTGEVLILPYIVTDSSRITTIKTRYVAGSHQVIRADKEVSIAIHKDIERMVIDAALSEVKNVDAVILSDYGKGVLTPAVLKAAIETATAAGKPVVIDPKSRDFSIYSGATLLSPNLQELSNTANRELNTDDDIVKAAKKLISKHNIANILVTRGKDGMTLVTNSGEVHHISAKAHEVFDVSGAGDTAIAMLALGIASGLSVKDSAILANVGAGIAVSRLGTAVVTAQDLKTELFSSTHTSGAHKILMLKDALAQVNKWKREGKTVGFTNGCFDLMHAGHLTMLNNTKLHCDKLVVGINSDASVERLKGEGRPVSKEIERTLLLASLSVVDMVIIFSEDTPLKLLEALKPDVLTKGADYQKHEVVGHELVEGYGGKVVLVPLKEGYSTTGTIKKINYLR